MNSQQEALASWLEEVCPGMAEAAVPAAALSSLRRSRIGFPAPAPSPPGGFFF